MNEKEGVYKDLSDKEIIEKFIVQQAIWTGKQMVPWINGGHVNENQITPNGIDLTIDKVFKHIGSTVLTVDKEFTHKGDLVRIFDNDNIHGLPPNSWFLSKGYYTIQWSETIEIPPNCIGLLLPRSTLLRTCATVFTAVWDRGYKGIGQSGLLLFDAMGLQRGTRLAQMIFIEAKMDGSMLYNGQYQGENLDEEENKDTKKEN